MLGDVGVAVAVVAGATLYLLSCICVLKEYERGVIMTPYPIAMQMRYLQALADVASDQNSTIIFPLPLELLRPFLQHAGGSSTGNSQPKDSAFARTDH